MTELKQEETSTISNKRGNILLGSGLAVTLSAAAFFSGMHIGSSAKVEAGDMPASLFSVFQVGSDEVGVADMTEFWQVWDLLDKKFVDATTTESFSTEAKVRGAISGMVNSFDDPYTVYMPPEDAEQFAETISGNFSGVGMEVGMRDSLITVISPLPDTPAAKSGILSGDVIVEIDGVSTKGMSIDEAVKLIRGEKGTEVVMQMYRKGASEFLEIPVTRDTISVPTIATRTEGDVFIVQLYNFNAISEMKMQEALQDYINSDAKSLVLDMRGNPGGFLQSAVAIASYFLPTGKIVVRESFGGDEEEQVYRTYGKKVVDVSPDNFVILVNGGSASAAEILAGALKEHEIATVIGEQTFGKGSVQELIPLKRKGSLKVTIARWLTPDGVSISDNGLAPNINIPMSAEDFLAGNDTQYNAAVEWLDGKRDFAVATLAEELENTAN